MILTIGQWTVSHAQQLWGALYRQINSTSAHLLKLTQAQDTRRLVSAAIVTLFIWRPTQLQILIKYLQIMILLFYILKKWLRFKTRIIKWTASVSQ